MSRKEPNPPPPIGARPKAPPGPPRASPFAAYDADIVAAFAAGLKAHLLSGDNRRYGVKFCNDDVFREEIVTAIDAFAAEFQEAKP